MASRVRQRWALFGALAVAAAAGCTPKIGDKCSVSTDCSQQGDRLCDPTQTGGYCTIFNCEPNRCPDEAVCVAFNEVSCSSDALSRRFQRTFCMFACESNDDCREGYVCLDTTNDPLRQIVDVSPPSSKFCAVAASGAPAPPTTDPAVCRLPDASPEIPTDAGADAPRLDAASEGAAPMEGAAPADGTALMDRAAPTDVATPLDASTPLDAAMAVDAAAEADVATPAEGAAADAAE